MTRFSSTVGTRPDVVTLTGTSGSALQSAEVTWSLRVHSAEAWDAVRVDVSPSTTVAAVKRAAMHELMSDALADLDAFVVKLHGVEIARESESVQAAGAIDGSSLLIMARRKRAVR